MEKFKCKKIIVIVILLIIIIGVVIGTIFYNQRRNYKLEEVTSIDYLIFVENERCGVINKSGEIVVQPVYDSIEIPNPSKPLFICMDNYNESTNEYNVVVLNDKSERILYEYVMVQAISVENTISSVPYEKSVLKYKQDGKWGLIDFNGKKITKPIYEEIQGLGYREGLLVVKKDSKCGVINIKGATIIKNKYDRIQCDGYYSSTDNYNKAGFIVSETTSQGYRYGYIDYNGKKILETEYNDITRILDKQDDNNAYLVAFKNGRAAVVKNKDVILNHEYDDVFYNSQSDLVIVQKNTKQGVMNINGNTVIPIEYDNIIISGKFINAQKDNEVQIYDISGNKQDNKGYISIGQTENENYNIAITANDEYIIVDKNGNALTQKKYENLQSIDGTYYIAKKNGKCGIIDISEKVLVDFNYDIMQILEPINIIQALKLDNTTTDLYDFKATKLTSMNKANIYIKSNYITIACSSDVLYFNSEGKQIKNTEIFNSELYAIKENGKWGFANKQGDIVVEAKYDMVTEFNNYGFAGIKQGEKWGVIKSDGKMILEPTYNLSEQFPEFIGEYYKVDLGYGAPYYTSDNVN